MRIPLSAASGCLVLMFIGLIAVCLGGQPFEQALGWVMIFSIFFMPIAFAVLLIGLLATVKMQKAMPQIPKEIVYPVGGALIPIILVLAFILFAPNAKETALPFILGRNNEVQPILIILAFVPGAISGEVLLKTSH